MRRRRRLLAIVVMISLVLPHFMQTREVKADGINGSNEDWKYELNEEQTGVILTEYKGSGGQLEIPGELEGYPVVEIGAYAVDGVITITGDLVIPDSVKKIGNCAFADCTRLNGTLTLPDELESIEEYAFSNCNFTGTLKIPSGVTVLNNSVFHGCDFEGQLVLPEAATYIGDSAFSDCRNFTGELVIPDTIDFMDGFAFMNCESIESVVIPAAVGIVRARSFENCYGLKKAVVPKEITKLESGAFGYCSSLTIYGYADSAAQAYAEENDIPFVDLEASATTSTPTITPSPSPTATPTMTPSPSPTATPTITSSPSPTATPTITPSPSPTAMSTSPLNFIPPLQVKNLQVKVKKKKYISLFWTAVKDVDGYEIYRSSAKNKGYIKIANLSVEKIAYVDKKVKRAKNYYYKVRAYRKANPRIYGLFSKCMKKMVRRKAPSYILQKKKTSQGIHYISIRMKTWKDPNVEIRVRRGKKRYRKVPLAYSGIKKNKGVFNFQYTSGKKAIWFQIRTYRKRKGKKQYSYAKTKRI